MMKFFRKYTKHLLAVFMALLLVVWLGGDALESMIRGSEGGEKAAVGTAYGQTVLNRDLWTVGHKAELAESFIPNADVPWLHILLNMGLASNPQFLRNLTFGIRPEPLTLEEWYLLDSEASRMGVHVPQSDIDKFKTQIGPDRLNAIMQGKQRMTEAQIDEALRLFMRVLSAARVGMDSMKATEADVQEMVRQTQERIRIVATVVEAKPFIDASYEPTPEELQAQFDKYKNVTSRPGNSMEYGYQLPATAQVQYIKIDAAALAARQKVTDDDAYAYWESNKASFTQPLPEPPTTNPASRPAPKPYETFTEARPKVIERLQQEKARGEAQRIALDLISALRRPWNEAPTTQPGNVRQIPAGEENLAVYQQIVDRYSQRYPDTLSVGQTEMLDQQKLAALPKVGRAAALPRTDQMITVEQAAFQVPGLQDPAELRDARFYHNLFETIAEPFTDADGNAYIIRTVAARPAHAPESLEQIRQRVVEDIRLQKAYQAAEKAASQLAERAGQSGLEQAVAADPELKAKLGTEPVRHPEPFSRRNMLSWGGIPQMVPGSIPGIGSEPELIEEAFSLAERKTATQPVAVAVHGQPARERWVVMQFVELLPVTRQEYMEQRDMALNLAQFRRRVSFLQEWFSAEGIRARAGWKELPERKAPEKEEKTGDAAA